MTYQVLARKWRPQKFQEVVGQEHITRSLQNAILSRRLGHAYLFTGTRGVGKTSVARIFAKALRCQNPNGHADACGHCDSCHDFRSSASLDIHELDGASHNKVEDIRELIETSQTRPAIGDYRIYIIDEVHMLSTAAFNALLKTLEEPPKHIVFILATTSPEKLPDTVLSRCQRFDFKYVGLESLIDLVKKISTVESICFTDDALIRQMCEQGRGSVRDTLSLFDQVLSYTPDKTINEEILATSLGFARREQIKSFVDSILVGKDCAASQLFKEMLQENVTLENMTRAVLEDLYTILLQPSNLQVSQVLTPPISKEELYWIYENMSQDIEWAIKSSLPERSLEVVFKKMALRRQFLLPASFEEEEKDKSSFSPPTPEKSSVSVQMKAAESKISYTSAPALKKWIAFINHMEKKSPALASNLKQGNIISSDKNEQASGGDTSFTLAFKNSGRVFYNYLSLSEVYEKVCGFLTDFFGVSRGKISLNLTIIADQEAGAGTLKTLAEEEREREIDTRESLEKKWIENPLIREAEQIFNAKIKKVKIEQGSFGAPERSV